MKNKKAKKTMFSIFLLSIIFLLCFFLVNYLNKERYEYNNDLLLATILANIKETYPEVEEEEIIKVLNTEQLNKNASLKLYGIDIENDSLSLSNKKIKRETNFFNLVLLFCYLLLLYIIVGTYTRKENKKIKEITHYMKEMNNRNYALDILSNKEDDLSILKNEIYKTAITLNEQTHLLQKEKESLKDSLSDISHQLKTPLTSITLMVDRLEDSSLKEEEKKEILTNMHRKISHINFLVYTLLKLSKFDANAITFNRKENKLEDLFKEVEDHLSSLCDLKGIKIKRKGKKEEYLLCDFKWQVEALTNIVKNSVEYAKENTVINISYQANELFTKIIIEDHGIGMEKEECKHIFDRFYKGKNAKESSIGIGLALAKAIIEKENGYITVTSTKGKGTTFTIKYLK